MRAAGLGLGLLLGGLAAANGPVRAADALAERWLGRAAEGIRFEFEASGREQYVVTQEGPEIVIRGSSGMAMASGLHAYLRQELGAHVSWGAGDRLVVPDRLPPVSRRIAATAPMDVRFAYNFCTLAYTSAWWGWERWEREIDYLALSGVTHALVLSGLESVYLETFRGEGYSDEEIRRWLVFPSHQPWQWMANLEGFERPVPPEVLKRRLELGRRIVARMRELGIVPVVPGYYGIVPGDYAQRHPGVRVSEQGHWVTPALNRPDLLNPEDPRFAVVADRYYAALRRMVGPISAFAADPFHEGGSVEGISLPNAGAEIYAAMTRADADATWVIQSWGGNPKMPLLERVPVERTLILDLSCERVEVWRERNAFDGRPWVWCQISNFGGNSGISGRLEWTAIGPVMAQRSAKRGRMSGIAAAPEGVQNNPLLWELVWGYSWSRQPARKLDQWGLSVLERRYGVERSGLGAVWEGFRTTVYSEWSGYPEMPVNSVVAALPSLDESPRARTWAAVGTRYAPERLRRLWVDLLGLPDGARASAGYQFDVVDVGLMVLGEAAGPIQREMLAAYRAQDAERVRRAGRAMDALILEMDALAGTREEFRVGTWLTDARRWGGTEAEKADCEWAARTLLTTWHNGKSALGDYSNRHWEGLLRDVYRVRWADWTERLAAAVDAGRAVDVAAARDAGQEIGLSWNRQVGGYGPAPVGEAWAVARAIAVRRGWMTP